MEGRGIGSFKESVIRSIKHRREGRKRASGERSVTRAHSLMEDKEESVSGRGLCPCLRLLRGQARCGRNSAPGCGNMEANGALTRGAWGCGGDASEKREQDRSEKH